MATRNNTFILKRSNVVNKIPVLSGLTLGELALNTADAKLYTLYTGGLTGATEVREIGWNRLSISGGTLYGQTYYSFGSGWTQNQTVDYISAATGNILVTKEWVESLSVDLSSSIAVNVATTSALPASTYNNGTNGVGATLTRNTSGTTGTIDGITVGLGDRILVKNQASQIQNGVYGVTVLGTGSTSFVLTRTTDSDTTVEFDPQIVIASRGTQAGLRFAQTTADPIIGTSNIIYTSVGSSFVTQSATGTQTSGNIPFWTNVARDLSKGSNTQLFWDNVNKRLGVGIGSPTASLHIKGSGTTNATYSLKVEDGLNRNILSTRNDNFVVVGDAAVNSYLWVNGGLIVTGNTVIKALTGTTALFSSSGPSVLTVIGSGSSTTLPLFSVQGSSGELFSVTDSLTGSLFSVNDISGLPILEVFSDNTILMGSYLAPSLNTTVRSTVNSGSTTLYSIPTSAYTGAFFEYTVNDGANLRAGSIMSIWSGNTVNYTETSTTDIGNTNPITFNVISSSGFASLRTSATTNSWIVKTIVRSI